MPFGILALTLASIFAGAAFYINFVEHPARMDLPVPQALAQWKPAYKRGYQMQAGLAVFGGLAGVASWYTSGAAVWMAGALLLLANWPFTLWGIMPVNRRLLAANEKKVEECRQLLERWNRLHAVRTSLGIASMLCFAAGLL
jgi:uncharacterized membrane protein